MEYIFSERIQYFRTSSQAKTLNSAAAQIGISQPALSLALQKLEEDLGYSLFVRSRMGIRLTEKGKALERLLKSLEISASISETNLIKLAPLMKWGVTSIHLPKVHRVLTEMGQRNFRILVSRSLFVLRAVEDESIDFGIVSWTTIPKGLKSYELASEQMRIVGLASEFSHLKKAKNLKQLSEAPWVHFPKPQYDWNETPSMSSMEYIVNDVAGLRQAILSGIAIGEAQLDAFTKEERSRLVILRVQPLHPNVKLYLVHKPQKKISDQLIQSIKNAFS